MKIKKIVKVGVGMEELLLLLVVHFLGLLEVRN
jgi:hypothetical protein